MLTCDSESIGLHADLSLPYVRARPSLRRHCRRRRRSRYLRPRSRPIRPHCRRSPHYLNWKTPRSLQFRIQILLQNHFRLRSKVKDK